MYFFLPKQKSLKLVISLGCWKIFVHIWAWKLSLEKSSIFAYAGVTNAKKNGVSGITNIRFTFNLRKYLGFRLFEGCITKQDFVEVVDRLESKLASWQDFERTILLVNLCSVVILFTNSLEYELLSLTSSMVYFVVSIVLLGFYPYGCLDFIPKRMKCENYLSSQKLVCSPQIYLICTCMPWEHATEDSDHIVLHMSLPITIFLFFFFF